MKLQTNRLLESLSFAEVKDLLSEVKETLAPDHKIKKSKIFTATRLWNIHSRRKNVNARKFYE